MSEVTATVETTETTVKSGKKFTFSIKELIARYENLGYKAKKKISFVISRIFLYFVLIEMAYLFILPFLYIFSTAFMTSRDYLDPSVEWIPTSFAWENFAKAFDGLSYVGSFIQSAGTSVLSAVLQTITCAIIGYSIGRFKYKGRNLIFFLVVLVLLIPPQTTIISSYGMWAQLGMINTWAPVVLPCLFGLGYRGALFVLIYMYFFQRIPDVLDDAARIDGAGPIRLFLQIMLPLVKSAIAIVAIFSFVWHWNDNYETPTYMFTEDMLTLQPRLERIQFYYSEHVSSGDAGATVFDKALSEPMLFAGCLLVMIPVLVVYILGQKQLTQGIERMGIIE